MTDTPTTAQLPTRMRARGRQLLDDQRAVVATMSGDHVEDAAAVARALAQAWNAHQPLRDACVAAHALLASLPLPEDLPGLPECRHQITDALRHVRCAHADELEPLSKADELLALATLRRRLGHESYVGPFIDQLLPQLVADMQVDLPTIPDIPALRSAVADAEIRLRDLKREAREVEHQLVTLKVARDGCRAALVTARRLVSDALAIPS